jgi:hypothetical protein
VELAEGGAAGAGGWVTGVGGGGARRAIDDGQKSGKGSVVFFLPFSHGGN